jgi:hypothetical protein
MNSELFKLMLQEQQTLRKQYYANEKSKKIIRTICNRRYKSKGDKGLEEIKESLKGYVDEMVLNNSQSGDL